MKRFMATLFTAALLAAALCASASASDFDAVAEDLSSIGMFRGTASGFELDRAPTRSEAAIMLVRLYGAEEEANADYAAGKISHPFTDVSQFTSPYVAWLYTNGITNGYTATTYASQRPCSTQNYVVFLLRALGYQDGQDFQYADALTFAREKGFYDPSMFPGAFLRDDLAALTYQALAADTADGSTYLLDSLIRSGAIDAAAAAPMTEKIELYRAMNAAASKRNSPAIDMDTTTKMDMTMTVAGESQTMFTGVTSSIQMDTTNPEKIRLASVMRYDLLGETLEISEWIKDGYVYVRMGSGGEKTGYKYAAPDQTEALESARAVDVSAMDVSGLAMIDSITENNGVYTVVIGKAMAGYMDNALSALADEEITADAEISDIVMTVTTDRAGNLKAMTMVFGITLQMESEGMVIEVAYDYDVAVSIKATGSKVKITYPSVLSTFPELSLEEIGSTGSPEL
ncbi:S-layer homology domain-containing protein [Dysosmobacter sp.]|uniref:S-layer homology domain-containing protein n=1 Tax=Dysosmobacter sp. TaxID=2591382 RepID=UPI002A8CBC90|nr:S-layer homology domain-containing protein [Dysosmobacter sp.]MDY3281283.1 S-layer homology domain-containing protein [Dysosmobacter sp.]